jgi:LAGLIDADG endonuclease
MNETTNINTDSLKDLFAYIGVSYDKVNPTLPVIKDYPLDENFLIGLIEGDGSFHINFYTNKRVQLGFNITQHVSNLELLKKLLLFFGCGSLIEQTPTVVKFQISNFNDISSILLPFVDKYQLHTYKVNHYLIYKEVAYLMNNKLHLSDSGFLDIVDKAYEMNLEGKRRKFSKKEYLERCGFTF